MPYLQLSLEVVLQLLRFVLHDGVHEACAQYMLHFEDHFFRGLMEYVGFCPCWCHVAEGAI